MFPLSSEADTRRLAQAVATQLKPSDCLTLTGTLGAGKTTFMRYLLEALGHQGQVVSPTFMLIQDYAITLPDGQRGKLNHIDAYRLKDSSEAEELGLGDMFGHSIVCIEWPEIIADWLPNDALQLTISVNDKQREASLVSHSRQEEINNISKEFHGQPA